ncbi:LPFR motif small protein [Actinomadura sp. GC306]|nr:LPFR motif small protein [Actinomadura sp. GC306]
MRRISGALSAIVGTIVSIVTLPLRVIQRLLTPGRGRTRSRGRSV